MARAAFIRSADILARVADWGRMVATAWAHRRIVSRLAALDDRLLHDMGITRQDVASALASGSLEDPTERLAERAREGRRARRETALERQRWAAMLSTGVPDGSGRPSALAGSAVAGERDCRAA